MQVKFVISALILLAVVVCLPGESDAYVGPPYADGLGTAGEHPWQDSESPPDGDKDGLEVTPRIVIIGGLAKAIVIRTSWIRWTVEVTRQAPEKIGSRRPTKKGND